MKKMRATIVRVGNTEAQNCGAKLMLEANRLSQTGFETARLPFHVSLKQTFLINDFNDFERFFDDFAPTVAQIEIPFEALVFSPNNSIGGTPSGVLALCATRTAELDALQKRLFRELTDAFGPCPAEHDDDYIFHMTVAIGKAPYESYVRAYEELMKKPIPKSLCFDKIAFFYYDDDAISAGSYFCYKMHELKKQA